MKAIFAVGSVNLVVWPAVYDSLKHTPTHILMDTHTHMQILARARVHTHTHMHACIHVERCTNIHVHTDAHTRTITVNSMNMLSPGQNKPYTIITLVKQMLAINS